MRTRRPLSLSRRLCIVALALAVVPALVAQVETIVAPAKRAEMLEQARGVLAPKPVPANAVNPFFSPTFNEVRSGVTAAAGGSQTSSGSETPGTATVTAPVGPKSNRDLLQAIATSIKPSGYFVLGGQPTLVFGQKRVKAGGLLTVTFEGKEYTLEVTALDRTNFTLRLNREEFTRPIK
jgi:hypothetical protein